MAVIDRDILLEALAALTGADVKHHHEMKPHPQPHHQPHQILQLEHFLHTIISKKVCSTDVFDATHVFCATDEMPLVKAKFFVDMEKFFDPCFDYDFRDMKESSTCRRGGEEYRRPIGWYRFALKVLGIYGDNAWLGTAGWRSESVPREWPVSFHGTSIDGTKGIAKENYKPGRRELHGRGIYSTPSIEVAEKYYATKFTSKKTGKNYKVIMQNRINPQERKIFKKEVTGVGDYWLIPVPDGTPPEEEKKIVHRSIRPYGILIKEVI